MTTLGFGIARTKSVAAATSDGTDATVARSDHAHFGVTSFNGRTGTVVPASGDYTAAQTTNAADKSSGSQQAFTGEVAAPDFLANGLTGATAASRYAGATASGHPTSGTFAVGDFVIDQTGVVWVCVTAGTPGTWNQVGGTTDAAWTDVSTFLNSWVNFGSPQENAGWRKVHGRVYLRGAVKSGTVGTAVFTLPVGYRPSASMSFAVVTNTASQTGNISVTSAGSVTTGTVNNAYVFFDGVSFDTL